MINNEDDVIWIEDADSPVREGEPLIGIHRDEDGMVSFASRVDPLTTARIFIGLANHIMENNIG